MLPRRILITGAAGNLGTKLHRHLTGRCELILLDRVAGDGIHTADLSVWDDSWAMLFVGIEAVVRLAGDPVAYHDWPELLGPNVDALLNVFEAAGRAGVRRVLFASSNHVMDGYQDGPPVPITPELPPKPGLHYTTGGEKRNSLAYGAAKLFGERVGKHYADVHGLEVLAIRLGWVWRGDNRSSGLPADRSDWFRRMWLSDRDYLNLMECCLAAPLPSRFVIVNGMSANSGMRWDLRSTSEAVGYTPCDDVTRPE